MRTPSFAQWLFITYNLQIRQRHLASVFLELYEEMNLLRQALFWQVDGDVILVDVVIHRCARCVIDASRVEVFGRLCCEGWRIAHCF